MKYIKTLPYFLVVVIAFSACSFSQRRCVKLFKKAEQEKPYDALVIPGIPYNGVQWDRIMQGRVYWAYYLYQNGFAKNIIFSGSAVYTPYVEAKVMAMYAKAIGIPEEHIFIETTAEHTTENLYYSYQMAKKKGWTKVAMASDPFQTKLMKVFANRKDLNITLIPMVFDTLQRMTRIDPAIDARSAYVDDFISITKRQSFYHRLRGTRGKHIKFVD